MKLFVLGSAVLSLASLTACTGPIAAQQQDDVRAGRSQVEVHSYYIATYIKAEQPIVNRVGSGQLQVAVQVQNIAENEQHIDYQYTFFNQGVQVEQSGWHPMTVDRKGTQQIQFTSMSPLVDDFHLEIRNLK